MDSIPSVYEFCKSKSSFTSEEQWRKRKNTWIKPEGNTDFLKCPTVNLNMVLVMLCLPICGIVDVCSVSCCFPWRHRSICCILHRVRERPEQNNSKSACKLCFHSTSYPFIFWSQHCRRIWHILQLPKISLVLVPPCPRSSLSSSPSPPLESRKRDSLLFTLYSLYWNKLHSVTYSLRCFHTNNG